MEERGHLGKKYEGESQDPSADLWGKIEPKIERKRRPFGLLWWLGLGGTMLLFVGLWKAGTDTIVPISYESKPAVHSKVNPKPSQTDEKLASAQNQTNHPKQESKIPTAIKPSPDFKEKNIDNQSVQDISSTESVSNDVTKNELNSVQKNKSRKKIRQTIQIKNPPIAVPFLVKSESKNEKKPTDKNSVSQNGNQANSVAKQESPKIENIPVAQLSEAEKSEKKEVSRNEISVPAESSNTAPPSNSESNSPTTPPAFESNAESSSLSPIDSANRRTNMELGLNSFVNTEPKVQEDTTQKKVKADSMTAQVSDTTHLDSGRVVQLKNWKLGFSLGGFYTSKNMTINQNPEENRVQVVNKNAFSSDRFAWSAAFWFQKSIRSQLSWYASLGVLFIQDQTDFKVQNDTILSFSERTDANGNKFLKPVYGEWNRSVQTRKLFLEMQAGLVYSNLFGPMGFKIGPGLNYLLWDDRKITEKPVRTGTEPTTTSGILPSIHVGLPFSWSLGRGQNLMVEPSVSYFLSPVFHPYPGADIKPFLAGLKIGFSW